MPLSLKKIRKSFFYASRGLIFTYKNEQNFRIQIFIGLLVIIAMVILKVQNYEAITLLLLIILVLVLELVNTIFEKIIDILKPRIHSYVEVIKDVMAAAVLVSSVGATIIAGLIFVPYLLALF